MKVVIAILWPGRATEFRTESSVKDARKTIKTLKQVHKVTAYVDSIVKDDAALKRTDDFFKKFL